MRFDDVDAADWIGHERDWAGVAVGLGVGRLVADGVGELVAAGLGAPLAMGVGLDEGVGFAAS